MKNAFSLVNVELLCFSHFAKTNSLITWLRTPPPSNAFKCLSQRKPCKICKFVQKQGCPIFIIFGVLEGLCTSILNPLNFLSEIQHGRRFGPEIPCKIPENWPYWHYYISVNTKPKYFMKWYTGRVEIFLSNVIVIDVWY